MIDSNKDMPFITTPEQLVKLSEITSEMVFNGLDPREVSAFSEIAQKDQGVFDLFELWFNSTSYDRGPIWHDITDSVGYWGVFA
jgi:hypothetical protein